jgi:hypothetical protein
LDSKKESNPASEIAKKHGQDPQAKVNEAKNAVLVKMTVGVKKIVKTVVSPPCVLMQIYYQNSQGDHECCYDAGD